MLLYALAPVAAIATLFGGWLVIRFLREGKAHVMRLLSGVAAGYLIAVTLVRVLPEAIEQGGDVMMLWALGGFVLVHAIEHGISPHFHYGEETHVHIGTSMTGVLALVGLSLHSMMDGMAITAAIRSHSNLGMLVFVGILLHRIPEGGTISSIFLARGFGARGAMMAALVLALAALLGSIGQGWLRIPLGPVLGVTAGLGIYVASSDLLPEAQKEKGWKSTLSLVAGVAILMISSALAPHDHGHVSGAAEQREMHHH
jgi:zinc transporter ZupT